jgi:hypothetical protein
MKVYVLTADTCDESWGSKIELFGVFTTKEKAENEASIMELYCYDINQVTIDEPKERLYLGGYIE